MNYNISFKNISKKFQSVLALDDISLDIGYGEIHALIGENGAGKSTLVKILGGAFPPSTGEIFIHGEKVLFQNAKDALKNNIRIVYQELQLIPQLTVAENLMLGNYFTVKGFIDKKKMNAYVQDILQKYNIDIKADTLVEDLSIGQQQLVEIAKCCINDYKIIALDEPTSSLSDKEIDILFNIIRILQKQNKTILYISHRFEEIFNICTSATVLRDGKLIKTYDSLQGVSSEELISCMIGRDVSTNIIYKDRTVGKICLKVKNLCSTFINSPMDFYVKEKEILGFYGLVGAGRTELMRCLVGADKKTSGTILYNNDLISNKTPKDSKLNGIAYLTEDRKKDGIINETNIIDNTMINSRKYYTKSSYFINNPSEEDTTTAYIKALKIKVSSPFDEITQLSGGNQQKVIVGRWLSNPHVKILILDEPTRGIDVGAKQEIYKLMIELADKGYSIILVSSELPEIISLCDRTYVLHQKKNIVEVTRTDINDQTLLNIAFTGKKGVKNE